MNKRAFLWTVLIALFLSKVTPDLKPRFPFWEFNKNPLDLIDVRAQQISGGNFGGGSNALHMYSLGADTTDGTGGTALQAFQPPFNFVIGAAPAATKWWFDCQIAYNQNTAAVADQFGLAFGVAPTNSENYLLVTTTAATAPISSTPVNITATSATQVTPTFTPAAAATIYNARLYGFIEEPASNVDNIVGINVAQATAADTITAKRDSVCMVHSVN